MPNFVKDYVSELNLGEQNTNFALYKGQAIGDTPFFNPAYAFSIEHLRQLFFMFFWAGAYPRCCCASLGCFLHHEATTRIRKRLSSPLPCDHASVSTQLFCARDCEARTNKGH